MAFKLGKEALVNLPPEIGVPYLKAIRQGREEPLNPEEIKAFCVMQQTLQPNKDRRFDCSDPDDPDDSD